MKSNRLKFWRSERALSQIELSQASGVPRWAIQLIESEIREPSADEREILARTLGIEPRELNASPREVNE